MNVARLLAVVLFLGLCNPVSGQTSHSFDITFDGTDPSVDSGSTNPVGVSLAPGDSFELDLHASPGKFWRVDAAYSQSFPLSFIVNPPADRFGDIETLFLLDGVEVENITKMNTLQSEVHIGAQEWMLPVGLEFDTVLMTYDLLSANAVVDNEFTEDPFLLPAVGTVIRDRPDIFGSISNPQRPFFRNSNISFNAIPEPSTFGLIVVGMLSLMTARRKQAGE